MPDADPKETPAAEVQAAKIVEVPLGPPRVMRVMFAVMAAMIAAVLVPSFLLFPTMPNSRLGVAGMILSYIGSIAVVFGVVLWRRRRARRRTRRRVAADDLSRPADMVAAVFDHKGDLGPWSHDITTQLVGSLMARGATHLTLRLGPVRHTAAVVPFSVPFEAVPLDQTHHSFEALEDNDLPAPDPTWSRIKRNVHLKGGWIWTAALLVNVLVFAFESYRNRTISPMLMVWGVLFCGTLFGTVGSWSARKQWLAVPGGMVLRKAARRGSGWQVHLFERTAAVLLVYRVDGRRWIARIADAEAHDQVVLTPRETTFMLRAWLSPLPPPTVQRLSDLVE